MIFSRRIAVLKQLNGGFSANGGEVSGVVRAENYADGVAIELSLINFAPLEEGRYVCAFFDGQSAEILECADKFFIEGRKAQKGFAFAVFFVRGNAVPVAYASCGEINAEVGALVRAIEQRESPPTSKVQDYSDDAIAEDNYYEYESSEDDCALFQDKKEEKSGESAFENEENCAHEQVDKGEKECLTGGLARGAFFERVSAEVEKIFLENERALDLEKIIENSAWAKIDYGDGKNYVFGVVKDGEIPLYFCYGVPSQNPEVCPKSMVGLGVYIQTEKGGYWVMYQDAKSGVSIEIKGA